MADGRRITVCICTHNRAEELRNCLEALSVQEGLQQAVVMVVDNNCTDNTSEVTESFRASIPHLVLVREETPGLSHARNRGLSEATTDFIAYIDDDCVPRSDWLSGILRAFEETGADAVGGRIIPYWRGKPPWFLSKPVRVLLSELDYGDGYDAPPDFLPYGGNMAYRVEALRGIGGFDTTFGVRSVGSSDETVYLGEETQACRRLQESGRKIVYFGGATVEHLTEPYRCRIGWLRRRASLAGRSVVAGGAACHQLSVLEESAASLYIRCLWSAFTLRPRDAIGFYLSYVLWMSAAEELAEAQGSRYVPLLRLPRLLVRYLKEKLAA